MQQAPLAAIPARILAGMPAVIPVSGAAALRPTRHIIGHFGNESFQAITCTGTDNTNNQYTKQIYQPYLQ